jgi:hypothetical protein
MRDDTIAYSRNLGNVGYGLFKITSAKYPGMSVRLVKDN